MNSPGVGDFRLGDRVLHGIRPGTFLKVEVKLVPAVKLVRAQGSRHRPEERATVVNDVMDKTRLNGDSTMAELVKRVSTDVSTLVRDEMTLAKIELAKKGKQAGLGASLLGGGGVMAWFGFGALVAAAILGLATVLDGWLSALIIGAFLLLIAGLLALIGRARLKRGIPPVPQEAIESIKADIDEVKGSVRS
jgi:Putative Actinobacterial Holin-X, holin superfamily III